MKTTLSYPCVRVLQDDDAKDLLMFAAPAWEIDGWIGIPQRINLAGNETAGFQRTVSRIREAALRSFFAERRNVIQNPLLCAIRKAPGVDVKFVPSAADAFTGVISIEVESWTEKSLLELLYSARVSLEDRFPDLKARPLPADLIDSLQQRLEPEMLESQVPVNDVTETSAIDDEEDDDQEDDEGGVTGPAAEEALFDESQMTEFWEHLRAREEIAKPSVPMMMRQLPPGSLDPQARKDSLSHADERHTESDRGGCRDRRRPQADGRRGTRLCLTGIIEPPEAPNVHCR